MVISAQLQEGHHEKEKQMSWEDGAEKQEGRRTEVRQLRAGPKAHVLEPTTVGDPTDLCAPPLRLWRNSSPSVVGKA